MNQCPLNVELQYLADILQTLQFKGYYRFQNAFFSTLNLHFATFI